MIATPSSPPASPRLEPRLAYELRLVERQVRAQRLHRQGAWVWAGLLLLAAALLGWSLLLPGLAPYALRVLMPAFFIAAALATWLAWRERTTTEDAARAIERSHPELETSLRAAMEQAPDDRGRFHFLQRRVIDAVLHHAGDVDWVRPLRRSARRWRGAHLLAIVGALLLSVVVVRRHQPLPPSSPPLAGGWEIHPGDAEVERGSTVVVTARFGTPAPRQVTLVWRPAGAAEQRLSMQQSLSDPVFAATLRNLQEPGSYHVIQDGSATAAYQLGVYDRPALVRADAALAYPAYTGLPERVIEDTRRISAVVGTRLHYAFRMNQPLTQARLRGADGNEVALAVAGDDPTRYELRDIITTSQRYTLHLVDAAGRTNATAPEIRIEALENRRPEVKLTFPRGDQRVSPVEELHLQAEVREDFGLQDYGIAFSVGNETPTFISLAAPPGEKPPVQAAVDHLLALEAHDAQPDQLVTWLAWADDIGPDGNVRRTSSDLAFAEVRALDEIFRENATGGQPAGQPGGGGPADELLEIQRQISVAVWRLQSRDPAAADFQTDVATLQESQAHARQQLEAVRERLEEARARQAADEAATFMEQAGRELQAAGARRALAPLTPAWNATQGAYQALLRLQPRETDVAQSRNNPGGGSGRRSQNQLNQLQFRQEEDRYATETQAQPPPTPEEREQLQVLARLRELARRQQDLNQRLQELQTALAAAEDEAQREEIRRELKRLEDEQRRMLADLDETRQRVDQLAPGDRTQQARQQLEQTREDMRRAGEQLAEGEVSQALAAGTRARENLQRTGEELRQDAAGRFGEQMREARRQARELAAEQQAAVRDLDEMNRGRQSLDDRAAREDLARRLEAQAARRNELLETLRQVTEDSEASEPQLHRQLYDLLRQQGRDGTEQQLSAGAELLRRGFLEPALDPQRDAARSLDQLQRGVERAAGAVLGDETSELRFVQRELDELTRELQRERLAGGEPAGGDRAGRDGEAAGPDSEGPVEAEGDAREARTPRSGTDRRRAEAPSSRQAPAPGEPGAPAPGDSPGESDAVVSLEELARQFGTAAGAGGTAGAGPLTGSGFADWAERLRTVEDLLEEPGLRQQLAQARFEAEEMRRGHLREARPPQWELVDVGIVRPLQDARTWVRQELNRREQPEALQPVDRDPVPERYAEAVRKYYEALGGD